MISEICQLLMTCNFLFPRFVYITNLCCVRQYIVLYFLDSPSITVVAHQRVCRRCDHVLYLSKYRQTEKRAFVCWFNEKCLQLASTNRTDSPAHFVRATIRQFFFCFVVRVTRAHCFDFLFYDDVLLGSLPITLWMLKTSLGRSSIDCLQIGEKNGTTKTNRLGVLTLMAYRKNFQINLSVRNWIFVYTWREIDIRGWFMLLLSKKKMYLFLDQYLHKQHSICLEKSGK